MNDEYSFLDDLNVKQKEICLSPENYILTACPGSGKTRTIIYRIAYLQKKYKESRKLNIAITYTNRAANEIDTRLNDMGVELSNVWAGTIHQFCMKFIIRPYGMYHVKLKKGYHVIDEYIKDQYCKEIASSLGIDVGYDNPLNFDEIKKAYLKILCENKEIDFDMILEISYDLLVNNKFISENISRLLRSIHVDEFQDTNELQYKILSRILIENNSINILFVGDVNQAIFNSLGGIAKNVNEITKMFKVEFKTECLNGCYRSTQRIIDFYVNYEVSSTGVFSASDYKDDVGIISYNKNISKTELARTISNIVQNQLEKGVLEKEICIVAPQWYQLYPLANELKKLLPNNKFDSPEIVPFKYDALNPFYILARLLFTTPGERVNVRKRLVIEFLEILQEEYGIFFSNKPDVFKILKLINSAQKQKDGIMFYKRAVDYIFEKLNIKFSEEVLLLKTYQKFLEKTESRIKRYELSCDYKILCNSFKEKDGIVINTIHGIKGEEYGTVIAFDLLNGHLPHWDYMYNPEKKIVRSEETKKLLYVLFSRAKENLFLFSERERTTKSGFELQGTDELEQLQYKYDVFD